MTSFFSDRAPRVVAALTAFTLSPLALAQSGAPAAPAAPERIVITASRLPQPLSSVLADLTVLEREDIERAGVAGVADLLARQPGIEIARNGGLGATTSVYVRGSETRHTAVYLDGVRVDSQSTGGAAWEQIPLDQIERIEILRGPAAAVYGSDAVAGVVQLFTRRGSGPARPTVALTLGSYRTRQGQLGVSGADDALSYALSASHGSSEGFDATLPGAWGHNPDKDGWQRSALQGRVGVQLNAAHRLDAALLASELTSAYDGSATTDDQSDHTLVSSNVAWQGRWSADATTRLQLGQTRSTYETQPSFYRTETRLRDYTLQHEQSLGGQVFTGTLERREDELFNPATAFDAAFDGQRYQDALGLGWRGDFGEHGLQAHVRRDEDSEFGGKTTGSLAWGWRFLPAWRVTASAATSFRVPTLFQRFSAYGVASLVPEAGRNVELGLRWAAAGHEASLTAWRNKLSNLIDFDPSAPPGTCASSYGCYQNIGRAALKGVTLAGRTTVAGVTLRASLDWHDPRNLDTDTLLHRRARRLATLGAETLLADWTLGAEVQAASRRSDSDWSPQMLAGYGLVNVYLSKALTPALQVEARVDNLGGKQYALAGNYATAGCHGQLTLRWTP